MGWYGLSDSEHEIMKYIWKHEEVTLREVVAWLENRGYTWKQQTVYTLLNRLIDKGAITAIKKGNYRLYYPAITEDELIGQWTENLVENEYQGSLKNFLLAFTRRKSLTRTEADELRKILDEKKNKAKIREQRRRNMWDLPMYMGLVGSVAYVAYKLLYRMTGKEKLSASGRWILLRLVMAFICFRFAAVRAVKENDKRLI